MTRDLPPNSAGELDAASDAAFAAVVAAIEKLEANSPQAPGSQVVTRRTESEAATAGNFPSIIATPKKCAAVVRGSGDACRGYAIRSSQFCLFHDPARVQSNREASSRGGRNRAITLEARLLDLDLHDRAGIQALIAQVIRLDLLGALSPRKAAGLHGLLRLLVSNARSMEASGRDTVYLENSETLISLTGMVSERMAHRERVDNTVPLALHAAGREIDVRAETSLRLLRRKSRSRNKPLDAAGPRPPFPAA